jgi:hypothetical protein
MIDRVVTAATENQDWQDAYNTSKNSNTSANVEYVHRALYYIGRLWIPTKDDLRKMICEVEHDYKLSYHIG